MNGPAIRMLLDRAVRLASRGHGGAEPNPMVGCVIVDPEGRVVGEGFHARCGGPHAEIEALRAAGGRARGATAVVTLEPCAHRGRTGPCADALIEAGVARVLYAVPDPNPIARGGAARLREAGIAAERVRHAGADELARPFVKRMTTGLPWVSAKWAQSLDGAIALASGESKWISGGRSRAMVHRERGRVDAILTGIGTVLDRRHRRQELAHHHRQRLRVLVFDPDAADDFTGGLGAFPGVGAIARLGAQDLDPLSRSGGRLRSRSISPIRSSIASDWRLPLAAASRPTTGLAPRNRKPSPNVTQTL